MVNYPNMKKKMNLQNPMMSSKHYTAHRGMSLEEDISLSNQYYLDNNLAVIYKKPTPIQIVKVDYPRRESAKIVEAYYKTLQPLTIMVYIKVDMWILKQKKQKSKHFRLEIFLNIKLIIYKELLIMEELLLLLLHSRL